VNQELLRKAAGKSLKKDEDIPDFRVGDTVNVSVKIVEGEKERIQVFRGTVILRRRSGRRQRSADEAGKSRVRHEGGGVSGTFTVRRIVDGEGVERTFPLHSPNLMGVEVVRSGRTRRSKLYYLRDRVGRATRLREVARQGGARAARGAADQDVKPAGDKAPAADQQDEGE